MECGLDGQYHQVGNEDMAAVNEREGGWDHVERLQNTATRLRKLGLQVPRGGPPASIDSNTPAYFKLGCTPTSLITTATSEPYLRASTSEGKWSNGPI